ncbi:MAG: hypothetical protein IKM66_00900 [Clostridia bacterium]|nr:hypothetical protein [Clostridia bacterium]
MTKTFRKVLSVVLCVMLMSAAMAPATYAAFDPEVSVNEEVSMFNKVLYNALDKVIDAVVGVINRFIPTPKAWVDKADYVSEGVMKGTDEFLDAPADGAYWSMGYANESILTENVMDGKHFVGGSLSVTDKTVSEIYDDLKVRTVAMSDNSGRGTAVFVVVDSYGISSTQAREIRAKMADYFKEAGIVSLNIAVLHQHSAVDTFGLNGSIFGALLNPFRSEPKNGLNAEYMENLYNVIEATVTEAVDSMTAGTLYHGTADFSEYVTDKRDPQVLDVDFDRFRFVPEDGKEIWFTTSAAHCVGNGAGGTEITGDYPYYMEQYINEKYDAEFLMILGAEQGTTQDHDSFTFPEEATTPERLDAYGKALADRFASIDNEKEVAPLLNIRSEEVFYTISNQILVFAGKMGLITNRCVVDGNNYQVVSEIGYMELGEDLAVALVPGEAAAELFYGGALSADKSWTGTEWTYAPLEDAAEGRKMIVFGIINDQIGYIIPDNDYMALLEPSNKSLELVATGSKTASTMVEDFEALIASVK